jgi:hypothetical protein
VLCLRFDNARSRSFFDEPAHTAGHPDVLAGRAAVDEHCRRADHDGQRPGARDRHVEALTVEDEAHARSVVEARRRRRENTM